MAVIGVVGVAGVFTAGLVMTPITIRIGARFGALDKPGKLKTHETPTPFLGGVAAFCALAIPVGYVHPLFLIPLALALALGLADDVADLSARVRLLAEGMIGITVALGSGAHGVGGLVWSMLLCALLINAVNLLDGLDALAIGVGIASCLGFAVLLHGDYRSLALALAAALAAVLVWNRPPAKVFLGDNGSYLVGVTLAILLADAFRGGGGPSASWAAALLVGVPIADTTVAITRRARAGRKLLKGDRGHIYDQLITRGATPITSALWCIGAQAALALAAIAFAQLTVVAAAAATVSVVVVVGGALLLRFTSPSNAQ